MQYIFRGKRYTAQQLKTVPYIRYLCEACEMSMNPERVASVEDISGNPLLRYVEKTIDILKQHKELSKYEYLLAETTLLWSEVAKGGSKKTRESWSKKGYILSVHNEASAAIYLEASEADVSNILTAKVAKAKAKHVKDIVYTLIYTHGLIGQHLRGEVDIKANMPLLELIEQGKIDGDSLSRILCAINHAIIGGISEGLWEECSGSVAKIIDKICVTKNISGSYKIINRLKLLFPTAYASVDELSGEEKKLFKDIFDKYALWYPSVALDSFSREEIVDIFGMIRRSIANDNNISNICNISFYPFVKNIFYDYEGKKRINVYKKRIIEFCLREMGQGIADAKSEEHVSFRFECAENTITMNVVFTPVCEKLIDFCVEAERSGIMDYQKNITTIFDLFGFRRDVFDRLNNEDKYLDTMNDVKASRKGELIDYAKGDVIVDVGSGGGVLLDALLKKYPGRTIIGTDISTNVIEALLRKKEQENKSYEVLKHNFVDGPLANKVSTIIFSSILHEVYSYTVYNGERFNIDAVKMALANAYKSLVPGGRILIRDGVYTASDKICKIKMKDKQGVIFLNNYLADFKGLTNLRDDNGAWLKDKAMLSGNVFTADINLIREFLYTYTWGEESYALEVNEQFGYFSKKDFEEYMKSLGMNIIMSEEYLEKGYEEHLSPLVELMGRFSFEDIPSNYMLIVEKQ